MEKDLHKTIKTLAQGRFTRLCQIVPAGTLEARLEKTGNVRFYWRGAVGSKTIRAAIGLYDRRASPKSTKPTANGFSIEAAKAAARELATLHIDNRTAGGLPAVQEAQREQARLEQEQARLEHEAKLEAGKYTLERLLMAYADWLEKQGKQSHRDVRGIFNNHVVSAFPKLAQLPANEITAEHISDMMRRLLESNRGRTANKLRTSIRAAYQAARHARTSPSIPVAFKSFGVTVNPAADVAPDQKQNRADKNPLTVEQMILYWRAIKGQPGLRGAVLRLHLLAGGQRIAQLVRLLDEDVTEDAITIIDAKGRPGTPPRQHKLPLIPAAQKALSEARSGGHFVLSSDGGDTHVHPTTVTQWAQAIMADTMPKFQLKQVRSGVETLLAKQGVSLEIRGRLQSHGITGIQATHYDAHDYLPEKKRALMTLYRVLEQKPAKVISIEARAK